MMWRKLSIRNRILLSYGLILVLAFVLSLFLVWRMNRFNQRIQQIQTSLISEVNTSVELTAHLITSQSAVERYLQQPQTSTLLAAQVSLNDFINNITVARQVLTRPDQQQRLEQIAQIHARYRTSFDALRRLLGQQEPVRDSVNSQLAQAGFLLDTMLRDYLSMDAPTDTQVVADLTAAQEHLRTASYLVLRMTPLDAETAGAEAQNELTQTVRRLNNHRAALANSSSVPNALENTLDAIELSRIGVLQMVDTLSQVQAEQDALINEPGTLLRQEVAAIEQEALNNLNRTTTMLEQQTRQTQQVALVALLMLPLLTALIGLGLSSTITRPIKTLVDATTRLHQGDYEVVVPVYDEKENGQLAVAFNRMTVTLKEQRHSLLEQQTAMAQHNQELEAALTEIQAATAARDELARTVRRLSVPIIPILEHVIVLPLVGEIDEERAHDLIRQLLSGVAQQHARLAIIDVTGVPMVDDLVARVILQATRAVSLLGAHCILVGIGPETAQALVATGADLTQLTTRADLRSAVAYALRLPAR